MATSNSETTTWSGYLAGQSLEGYLDFLALHGPMIKEILAESPESFLEVGCGGANLSIFFSQMGLTSVGIDIDPAVVEEAKRHASSLRANVVIRVGDGFKTDFEDHQFDVSASQGVLEHFPDEEIHSFLKESIRISRRVIASMPNNNYPVKDFGNERLMPLEFWKARGEQALKESGQNGIVKAYDYRRRPDFKHPVNSLLNTLRRRCYFTLLVIDFKS